MQFKIEKDKDGDDTLSIAIMVFMESDHTLKNKHGYVWIGSINKGDGEFKQNDHICLDLPDCRLVVHVADRIEAEGFDKIYDEADKNSSLEGF